MRISVKAYVNQYMIVFNSYNQAMLLYNEMNKIGLVPTMVSTPCGLKRGCNQSIIIPIEYVDMTVNLIKEKDIKVADVYKIMYRSNKVVYEPVKIVKVVL